MWVAGVCLNFKVRVRDMVNTTDLLLGMLLRLVRPVDRVCRGPGTGGRGLCPAGFIAHLRLYRHIRQAAIREFFLFAVGSHAVIIYFGWLGLALYNIVVRIMARVDVRVRVTQG